MAAKSRISEADRAKLTYNKIAQWLEVAGRGITPKDRKRGRDNARRLAKKYGWKI